MSISDLGRNFKYQPRKSSWRSAILKGRYISQMTKVEDVQALMEQVQNIRELKAHTDEEAELRSLYEDLRDRMYVLIRNNSEKRDCAILRSENKMLSKLNAALESGNVEKYQSVMNELFTVA